MPGGDFENDERVQGRKRPSQCHHIKIISTYYKISSIPRLFIEYKYRKSIVCAIPCPWSGRISNARIDVAFRVGRLGALSASRRHSIRPDRRSLQGTTPGIEFRESARLPPSGSGRGDDDRSAGCHTACLPEGTIVQRIRRSDARTIPCRSREAAQTREPAICGRNRRAAQNRTTTDAVRRRHPDEENCANAR